MPTVVPPERRTCTRCGRTDVWADDAGTWVVADADDESVRGEPHCLHEWDINGAYNPVREDA